MSATSSDRIEFEATSDLKRQLEEGAAKLNLTVAAYVQYLVSRQRASVGPKRFDRMAREVFGRYGPVVRKLAQ